MSKRLEIDVDGVRATFLLDEELAPKTTAALWEALPVEAPIRHVKMSGDACYFMVEGGPLAALPEAPELGETSIYRGYVSVVRAHGRPSTELLISYGQAEYRGATGRRYATPVGEIQGDPTALFDALRRTQVEGEKRIAVRRLDS